MIMIQSEQIDRDSKKISLIEDQIVTSEKEKTLV
jgi:hypothetical protein